MRSGSIVIEGATAFVHDGGSAEWRPDYYLIDNGEITAVGKDIEPPEAARRIHANGNLLLPGFTDTHTHLWNGLWRTLADASPTGPTYGDVALTLGPLHTPEDSYWAVRAACFELLRSGVTTVHNWAHNLISPEHADAEMAALRDAGIRARFSYGYHWTQDTRRTLDFDDILRIRTENASELIDVGIALRNDESQLKGPPRFPSLSVSHSVLAAEMEFARDNDLPITFHTLEPASADYWLEHGFIGPHSIAIHGYTWSADDFAKIAAAGGKVSISPYTATFTLGRTVPVDALLQSNVQVGLSFDHVSRLGTPDMFRQMQTVAMSARLRGEKAVEPSRLITMATSGGSELLDRGTSTGRIAVGYRADLILMDSDDIGFQPLVDNSAAVVTCGNPQLVDLVMVDGVIVKEDGRMRHDDGAELAWRVTDVLGGLMQRAGQV
jgi:cytosine/adenosine deaminase-related metal-dependent hydrolase